MASRIRPLLQYMLDSKAWIGYFAFATGASAMVKGALVDLHAVPGQSMAPTLSPAFNETGTYDHIITIKRNLRGKPPNPEFQSSIEFLRPARSTIKRGDLVTFWKPHNPEILGVKRVIGLEGDTIIRNVKRVGKQSNEAGKESEKMGMAVPPPVVKVPPGHIWVEGDNWRHTVDSNDYGTIPVSLVTARVVGIYWPPSRMGSIPELHSKDAARSTAIPGRTEFPMGWDG